MTRPFLLSILFLALAGCGVPKPIEGRNDPYDRQQVMFADDKLKKQTAVGTPIATRDAANLLFVTVPVRSTVNNRIDIQYRVTWFDQSGQVINQTAWLMKSLTANVPDQIIANSTTQRAADFQVDLRYNPREQP